MEDLQHQSPSSRMAKLLSLSRASLQKLAKEAGVKANVKSAEIISNIVALFDEKRSSSDASSPESDKSKQVEDSGEKSSDRLGLQQEWTRLHHVCEILKNVESAVLREQAASMSALEDDQIQAAPDNGFPADERPAEEGERSCNLQHLLAIEQQQQNTGRAVSRQYDRDSTTKLASQSTAHAMEERTPDDWLSSADVENAMAAGEDDMDSAAMPDGHQANQAKSEAARASSRPCDQTLEQMMWKATASPKSRRPLSPEPTLMESSLPDASFAALPEEATCGSEDQQTSLTSNPVFAAQIELPTATAEDPGHTQRMLELEAVERLVFGETAASGEIPHQADKQLATQCSGPLIDAALPNNYQPVPSDEQISMCTNPSFEETDTKLSRKASAASQLQKQAFEKGRKSGLWHGKAEVHLGQLEQHWSSIKESSLRGWNMPSLDEVKAEGLRLAASGYTTVKTPSLCESSKQAVLQQRRANFQHDLPRISLNRKGSSRSGSLGRQNRSSPKQSTPLHRRRPTNESCRAVPTPSRLAKESKGPYLPEAAGFAMDGEALPVKPCFTPEVAESFRQEFAGAKAKNKGSLAQQERAKKAEANFAARRAAALAKARKN